MSPHVRIFCLLLLVGLFPSLNAAASLDPLIWKANASEGARQAHKAIDGDPATRWDTSASQAVGQWFLIDMREARLIHWMEIDTEKSANDYARKYDLAVSLDGTRWRSVAPGDGAILTEIRLPVETRARYLRLSIADDSDLSGGYWSIHEVRVFGSEDPAATPRPAIRWRTVETGFPTRDLVVVGYDIRDLGIDPAAGTDATLAIETASALLARAGGGTHWLPTGRYRLSGPIVLDQNVCIRGDWHKPEPGKPVRGTILEMTANRGNADAAPVITNGGQSMLRIDDGASAHLTAAVLRGSSTFADLPSDQADAAAIDGLVMMHDGSPTIFPSFDDIPENRITVRVSGTTAGVAFSSDDALPSDTWKARYILIRNLSKNGLYWSIHEIEICGS